MTRSEALIERNKRSATHGMSRTVEYRTWIGIKKRCYNRNATNFHLYGGKGVTVCARWLGSFEAFLEDMGPRPGRGYSIERKDGSKGYSPDNCVWADAVTQNNNRNFNVAYEWGGRKQTIPQWAREYGVSITMVRQRVAAGLPIDVAVTIPSIPRELRRYKRVVM